MVSAVYYLKATFSSAEDLNSKVEKIKEFLNQGEDAGTGGRKTGGGRKTMKRTRMNPLRNSTRSFLLSRNI